MSIYDLLDSLESEEHKFLETEFLAPVLPGGQVRVRIVGLVCTLRVSGEFEPGWAILKPQSMDRARVVSRPSLQQVRDYLALFPAVRLLLVSRASRAPSTGSGQAWLAIPAHRGTAVSRSRAQYASTWWRVLNLFSASSPALTAHCSGSRRWTAVAVRPSPLICGRNWTPGHAPRISTSPH